MGGSSTSEVVPIPVEAFVSKVFEDGPLPSCIPSLILFLVPLLFIPAFFLHPEGFVWALVQNSDRVVRSIRDTLLKVLEVLFDGSKITFLFAFWVLALTGSIAWARRYAQVASGLDRTDILQRSKTIYSHKLSSSPTTKTSTRQSIKNDSSSKRLSNVFVPVRLSLVAKSTLKGWSSSTSSSKIQSASSIMQQLSESKKRTNEISRKRAESDQSSIASSSSEQSSDEDELSDLCDTAFAKESCSRNTAKGINRKRIVVTSKAGHTTMMKVSQKSSMGYYPEHVTQNKSVIEATTSGSSIQSAPTLSSDKPVTNYDMVQNDNAQSLQTNENLGLECQGSESTYTSTPKSIRSTTYCSTASAEAVTQDSIDPGNLSNLSHPVNTTTKVTNPRHLLTKSGALGYHPKENNRLPATGSTLASTITNGINKMRRGEFDSYSNVNGRKSSSNVVSKQHWSHETTNQHPLKTLHSSNGSRKSSSVVKGTRVQPQRHQNQGLSSPTTHSDQTNTSVKQSWQNKPRESHIQSSQFPGNNRQSPSHVSHGNNSNNNAFAWSKSLVRRENERKPQQNNRRNRFRSDSGDSRDFSRQQQKSMMLNERGLQQHESDFQGRVHKYEESGGKAMRNSPRPLNPRAPDFQTSHTRSIYHGEIYATENNNNQSASDSLSRNMIAQLNSAMHNQHDTLKYPLRRHVSHEFGKDERNRYTSHDNQKSSFYQHDLYNRCEVEEKDPMYSPFDSKNGMRIPGSSDHMYRNSQTSYQGNGLSSMGRQYSEQQLGPSASDIELLEFDMQSIAAQMSSSVLDYE